jgi:hypothetical protein
LSGTIREDTDLHSLVHPNTIGMAARLLLPATRGCPAKGDNAMPMRQTIGISLAFLMISTGARRLNPFNTKFHAVLRPPVAIRGEVPFLETTAMCAKTGENKW